MTIHLRRFHLHRGAMPRLQLTALVFLGLSSTCALAAWTMQEFRDAMKTWAASEHLDDPNDALHNWRDPDATQVCQFEGIDCYYYYDIYWITHVDLDSLDLTGAIPPWMWAVATDSINLSNNQWYNTTVFYEDTSGGPEQDATQLLKTLNCSNCGFFLKAEEGTTVLPEEWSRYVALLEFDISQNPNLIGQLPLSWETGWSSIADVHIKDTPICEPFPFPKNGDVRVYGDYMSLDQCPELPEIPPWEPTPPDPPEFPPYYAIEALDEAPVEEPDTDELITSLVAIYWPDGEPSLPELQSEVEETIVPQDAVESPSVVMPPAPPPPLDADEIPSTTPLDIDSVMPSEVPQSASVQLSEGESDAEWSTVAAPQSGWNQIGHSDSEGETGLDEESIPSAIDALSCDSTIDRGELSAPLLTSASTVEVSLHYADHGFHVCEELLCSLRLEPDCEIDGPFEDTTEETLNWRISPGHDGEYRAKLVWFDSGGEMCQIGETVSITVDWTPPICDVVTVENESPELSIVTVLCSEEITLSDTVSIEVSENGEIQSLRAVGASIEISVRVLDARYATMQLSIAANSFRDLAGNIGVDGIVVEIPVPSEIGIGGVIAAVNEAPVDGLVAGTIVVSGGLSTGAAILGGSGSGGGFGLKSNIVRAGFHLQFLALTAHLAVPKLSRSYISTARRFSWTTLAFDGTDSIETTPRRPPTLLHEPIKGAVSGRRRLHEITVVEEEAPRGKREREAFFDALAGYSVFLAICLFLRAVVEILLKRFRRRERPALLTFPRLEIQAVAITIPPLTFASTRLVLVGSPASVQPGLLGLVVFVLPYTVWYVFSLTIRSLILKPEFSIERISYQEEADLEERFKKKGESRLFSTVSGDLIGVAVRDGGIDVPLPLVPPHEEEIGDFVNDVDRPLSSRLSTTPRTRLPTPDASDNDFATGFRASRIHPTTSEDESRCLLRTQRQSTASVGAVEIEASDDLAWRPPPSPDTHDPSSACDSERAEWRFVERRPEKQFLRRYGFLLDDVIGLDPVVARTRLRPRYLLTHAAFFLHKIASAGLFGCTTAARRSPAQVFLLLLLQIGLVTHLYIVRPFILRGLYCIEAMVCGLELGILMAAVLLLYDVGVPFVNSVMVVLFLSATSLLGLYELRHLWALLSRRRCAKV